jgi:hypothetical protein
MVYLLSEIHSLPVWLSLISRGRRGDVEEGRTTETWE